MLHEQQKQPSPNATHGLTPDECVRLTDVLVGIQPYPSWLEDRDWTREAWLRA